MSTYREHFKKELEMEYGTLSDELLNMKVSSMIAGKRYSPEDIMCGLAMLDYKMAEKEVAHTQKENYVPKESYAQEESYAPLENLVQKKSDIIIENYTNNTENEMRVRELIRKTFSIIDSDKQYNLACNILESIPSNVLVQYPFDSWAAILDYWSIWCQSQQSVKKKRPSYRDDVEHLIHNNLGVVYGEPMEDAVELIYRHIPESLKSSSEDKYATIYKFWDSWFEVYKNIESDVRMKIASDTGVRDISAQDSIIKNYVDSLPLHIRSEWCNITWLLVDAYYDEMIRGVKGKNYYTWRA